MEYKLFLPFPPTINSYYVQGPSVTRGKLRSFSGRVISRLGRIFREKVGIALNEQVPGLFLDTPVRIVTILHPPDKRVRDLDNYIKPLFDSLTHNKLWMDDVLVDQHENYRGVVASDGLTRIHITESGPVLPLDYWP